VFVKGAPVPWHNGHDQSKSAWRWSPSFHFTQHWTVFGAATALQLYADLKKDSISGRPSPSP